MDLTQLTDAPELTVEAGGKRYSFSELPVEALTRLQTWIRNHTEHPIEAIKPHLAGLPDSDRQYLLERARQEAANWPPQIGTKAGAAALLGSEAGQVEALWEGLRVHQPTVTRDEARRFYKALDRNAAARRRQASKEGRVESGESTVTRIYSVIFGNGDPEDERPKD